MQYSQKRSDVVQWMLGQGKEGLVGGTRQEGQKSFPCMLPPAAYMHAMLPCRNPPSFKGPTSRAPLNPVCTKSIQSSQTRGPPKSPKAETPDSATCLAYRWCVCRTLLLAAAKGEHRAASAAPQG
jgi:hypothetical protein